MVYNFKWTTLQFKPPWQDKSDDNNRRSEAIESKAADEFEGCIAAVGVLAVLISLHALVSAKYKLPLALNFPTVRECSI